MSIRINEDTRSRLRAALDWAIREHVKRNGGRMAKRMVLTYVTHQIHNSRLGR